MILWLLPLDELRLSPAITVADALCDFPRLDMREGGEVVRYTRKPQSDYARLMRNGNRETYNH